MEQHKHGCPRSRSETWESTTPSESQRTFSWPWVTLRAMLTAVVFRTPPARHIQSPVTGHGFQPCRNRRQKSPGFQPLRDASEFMHQSEVIRSEALKPAICKGNLRIMLPTWLPRAVGPAIIMFVLVSLKRIAPPRSRTVQHRFEEMQAPEPLPTGVVGGTMWGLGIGLALMFFVLRDANLWWASLDGSAILTQFATPVIWCFFPLFAALSIPWPLTVWYLRRLGRWEEADSIEDASDSKGGMNSYQVMKWLGFGLVGPIALLTLLAIPIHLSIGDSEVRVGHYASFQTERFPFKEAKRLTIVDGYRRKDGSFRPAKDVIIDFSDGRRLRGNQVGDGGTNIPNDVMQLLIARTGLTPEHATTADGIPAIRVQR
jgi:hypothetical protein